MSNVNGHRSRPRHLQLAKTAVGRPREAGHAVRPSRREPRRLATDPVEPEPARARAVRGRGDEPASTRREVVRDARRDGIQQRGASRGDDARSDSSAIAIPYPCTDARSTVR